MFAELGAFWDKTSSEAIDKAISVLMNYFEWSLKDPKSSEVEFKKLVTEIHATVETRDISNLVSYNANKWTYVFKFVRSFLESIKCLACWPEMPPDKIE